ncbi:unnamed protein product [Pleuronectes platessa]|uniref:Uncharacterized protein n=1 Tax=Pleuronectes platessa TaxID=8262 RepID=A0A9N7UD49_PLEPL|nr:unnamed protein product [Pleuronectes platessa]
MTLLGPINSQRLLEHQVMANQALELQPRRLHCADSAPVKARDLQGSQLVTADHQSGGSAGRFRSRRGSQLTQRLQPAPAIQSQAPLRPCPRQGRETPGQATETLPAADCLMLTTERIQAKGGGARREPRSPARRFSRLYCFSCVY